MKQNDETLAARSSRNERSSVGKIGPDFLRQIGGRFRKNLAADADIGIDRQTGKGWIGVERGYRLRLFPTQGAAELAAAGAQLHRNEIVMAASEARTGEAEENPAVLHPVNDGIAAGSRHNADIGEDEEGEATGNQIADASGLVSRLAQFGIGLKRAGDIVKRWQQRLFKLESGACGNANRLAPPAIIDKLNGAGIALTGDFEAGEFVAQFERQVEHGLLAKRIGTEVEPMFHEAAAVAG